MPRAVLAILTFSGRWPLFFLFATVCLHQPQSLEPLPSVFGARSKRSGSRLCDSNLLKRPWEFQLPDDTMDGWMPGEGFIVGIRTSRLLRTL